MRVQHAKQMVNAKTFKNNTLCADDKLCSILFLINFLAKISYFTLQKNMIFISADKYHTPTLKIDTENRTTKPQICRILYPCIYYFS